MRNVLDSPDDLIAEYRDKQRAGFMYGTLRNARSSRSGLDDGSLADGPEVIAGLGPESGLLVHDQLVHEGEEGAKSVVPPPPMFEENKLNAKTPLVGKNGRPAKNGKKQDKMESRV